MACEGMALKPFNQTQQAEDLEMKRLAWNLTGELCQNEQCLKEAVGLGLLRSLLMYVDEESAASLAARWPPDQLRDLTLQSLSLMYLVVPHCHAQFSNLDGCRLVMRFVEEARSRDVKMVRPVKLSREGGRGEERRRRRCNDTMIFVSERMRSVAVMVHGCTCTRVSVRED